MKVLLTLFTLSVIFVGETINLKLHVDEELNFTFLTENGVEKENGVFVFGNSSQTLKSCIHHPSKCLNQWIKTNKANNSKCIDVEVVQDVKMCFRYEKNDWFGGTERYMQYWPVQQLIIKEEPMITRMEQAEAVVESYWLTSAGASIYVEMGVPLFVDSNHLMNEGFCFWAKNTAPYRHEQTNHLRYQYCAFDDARTAHEHSIAEYLKYPTKPIDKRMVHNPIWSTWARYKKDINASIVLKFADEINKYHFTNSQLEIDDFWETCYGELEFDPIKFPNVRELTDKLKEKGFRVTLWVHPFLNVNCQPSYIQALMNRRLVFSENATTESYWWNGIGGHIDFSNTTTRDWFIQRLKLLVDRDGIDAFKFDAGESSWLPQLPVINSTSYFPDQFSAQYVDMALHFGNFIEVRVGRRTQDRAVFIRMIDKDSRWSVMNGLRSLVTTLLQMNMAGYSYVLPDMIGGNQYAQTLTKELFIRWLQANIFMPSLQFSVTPWDFDEETVVISHKLLGLRKRFEDKIDSVFERYRQTGAPINPPVWWLSPTNRDALKCNDEYLLGDKLLIAPVMDDGARSRDIFLPNGQWRDVSISDAPIIRGPTWLKNYSVPLEHVPVFENLEKNVVPEVVLLANDSD